MYLKDPISAYLPGLAIAFRLVMTLAITCDVAGSWDTHMVPHGAHGILLALQKQKTCAPRGNLLQVSLDPISGSPRVIPESAPHRPFMGFRYMGPMYVHLF